MDNNLLKTTYQTFQIFFFARKHLTSEVAQRPQSCLGKKIGSGYLQLF